MSARNQDPDLRDVEPPAGESIMRLRRLPDPDHLPALDQQYLQERPARGLGPEDHRPRILMLYGSLRPRSYSRLATEEAARLLGLLGAEVRIFAALLSQSAGVLATRPLRVRWSR